MAAQPESVTATIKTGIVFFIRNTYVFHKCELNRGLIVEKTLIQSSFFLGRTPRHPRLASAIEWIQKNCLLRSLVSEKYESPQFLATAILT